MAIIIFVRHGENAWVKKNRLAGWIPGVHLNKKGHQQAAGAAERLAGMPVKAIYSSPVTRCVETAAYIADVHELPVHQLDDLGEVRYGKWEGKKIKKLAKKKSWHAVQHFPSRFRFPKGEALREVQFRAVQAVEQLNKQHKDEIIVLVSHADLIKMVLAHYLGVHLDLFQRIAVSPGSVSILALGKQAGVQILRLNDTGPITLPQPPQKQQKATSDEEE
ncbi:MAG: MSMEG_4193 family putative phosphomutase [Anaerolineales bacterium]|nr:MSMEG_4193 family putative phosphomutase [Anaerolineales bacterium]